MRVANHILEKYYSKGTLVFGHRGAKGYAPMNTLPAFELALKQGADGVELDVHRSCDNYPVILHDFTVDGTTDGTGRVTEMTLAQLKELDAGSWFNPSFKGVQIPTLDEVFETLGKRLLVNVEIKSESIETDGVEDVVANCIRRHNMADSVIVSSFNPLVLKRFRQIAPDIPLGFLFAPDTLDFAQPLLHGVTYECRHPYHDMISQADIAQARANGYWVNTWTVNQPQRAVELRDMGVNGIITDFPDLIIAALSA